jgi:hypothetical protein
MRKILFYFLSVYQQDLAPSWERKSAARPHLDLGGEVEVLRSFALEESEPVEDVGEEGEEEEAGHNGEDQDPERDGSGLGGNNRQHLPTNNC